MYVCTYVCGNDEQEIFHLFLDKKFAGTYQNEHKINAKYSVLYLCNYFVWQHWPHLIFLFNFFLLIRRASKR